MKTLVYEFSIEHFQELFIVCLQAVTILYQQFLLLFSHVFLILLQRILVFPVRQDLSRLGAFVGEGVHKAPSFWLGN